MSSWGLLYRSDLAVLLMIALVLRIPGIAGYPFIDEFHTVINVHHFLKEATLIPVDTLYPTFFSYLTVPPTLLLALVLKSVGMLRSTDELLLFLPLGSSVPYLAGRGVSLLAGVATVAIAYVLGDRFYGRRVAVLAALFCALSPFQIDFSTMCLVDMTTALLATASLALSVKAAHSARKRDLWGAAILAGLATSTKYNSALVSLAVSAAFASVLKSRGRLLSWKAWLGPECLVLPALFLVSFCLASPGWVLDFPLLWKGFQYNLNVVTSIGHSVFHSRPYLGLLANVWQSETSLALAFLVGAIVALVRRQRSDVILLAGFIPSWLYIGSWKYQAGHYVLFTLPILGVLAARAIHELAVKIHPVSGKANGWMLIPFLVFAYPLWRDLRQGYLGFQADSRRSARMWIQKNLPANSLVAIDAMYSPALITPEEKQLLIQSDCGPYLRSQFDAERPFQVHLFTADPHFLEQAPDEFLILSSYYYDRFLKSDGPPPDDPEYAIARQTYRNLLQKDGWGEWRRIQDFPGEPGPDLTILHRDRGGRGE